MSEPTPNRSTRVDPLKRLAIGWTIAGGSGLAAAVIFALRPPLPDLAPALTAVAAIGAGWCLMLLLAPWRRMASLELDRQAVRQIISKLRQSEESDVIPDLRVDRDDLYGELARQIHHALARQAAMAQHNRMLRRTMQDTIKRETTRATQRLRREATTDPLTKLGNRRIMREAMSRFFMRDPQRGSLTLILIDVDNFKIINDTLGHEAGDACLRFLGELLTSCLRGSDTPVRVGGDEFLILIEDQPQTRSVELAQRLSALMRQMPWPYEGVARPTLSVGIASARCDLEGGDASLLRRADEALYAAKRGGRNRIEIYSSAMEEAA